MFTSNDMKLIRAANLQLWGAGVDKTAVNSYSPPSGTKIELKANDGYIISKVTYLYWGVGGSASSATTITPTLSADKKTATYTLVSASTDYNTGDLITIVDAPISGLVDQTMLDTVNAVNATISLNGSKVTAPKQADLNSTVLITAPTGKLFTSATIDTASTSGVALPIATDKKSVTFRNTSASTGYTNLQLALENEPVSGLFSTAMIKIINDNNCDLYYNGALVETELLGVIGNTYEIRCRDGWVFDGDKDLFGIGVYGRYVNASGSYVVDQWTISEDLKTATKTLDVSRNYSVLTINTEQTAPIDVIGGVNNVYKVDADIMEKLTKDRFFVTNIGGGGEYIQYDYGQYIINLMQLPFAVPTQNIIGSENIQMATLETTTVAPVINTDRITYDLGNITIDGVNDDLTDFTNRQAILRLPFSDPIIIENQYVINETITAYLTINLYTGTGTYNILSTKTEKVIITKTVSLGVNIPLANFFSLDSKQYLSSSMDWSGDNNLRYAYLELIDTNSDLNRGFFNNPIMDDTLIGNVSGYFTVSNVDLVLQASSSEKSQITAMLASGVIIK